MCWKAWKRQPDRVRNAGISSFGISGTNAHVVLQEAPPEPERAPRPARAGELLVLSGRTGAALEQAAGELSAYLGAHPELEVGEVAATLARGRGHRAHRLSLVVRSREDAIVALDAAARRESLPPARREIASVSPEKLGWLFTGQGSQWTGMGRGLAAEWPVFRRTLDEAVTALDVHLDQPLRPIMWGDRTAAGLLDQTGYCQPALFALEVALAALWRSWGVHPDVMLGHSVGELVAAHVAGVFSLDDAARLVVARARLMQALPAGGAMVSIAASAARVADAVAPHAERVSIAAVNGPESVVISGAETSVIRIAEAFADRGVATRRLVVSHAFHSPLMEPMLEDLRRVAESVAYRAPTCLLVSNVHGSLAGEDVMTADYWVQHVRRAVQFSDGVRAARVSGVRRFVELGPKPTLLGLVSACLREDVEGLVLLASMREPRHEIRDELRGEERDDGRRGERHAQRSETETVLEALGGIHAHGGAVDWAGLFPARERRVELPTYPWQRQAYWIDHRGGKRDVEAAGLAPVQHPLLGAAVERADGEGHLFTAKLSLRQTPWLGQHEVHGAVLFPGTGFIDLALAIARELGMSSVSELTLTAPMVLPERGALELQVWVERPDAAGDRSLAMYSRRAEGDTDGGGWTCHAKGQLASERGSDLPGAWSSEWPVPGAERVDLSGLYDRLSTAGLTYGPAFRGLEELWRNADEVHALIELPAPLVHDAKHYAIHPALLDAALHALHVVLPEHPGLTLPFEWRQVRSNATGATQLRVRMQIIERGAGLAKVRLEARDAAARLVVEIGELVVKATTAERMQGAVSRLGARPFQVRWESMTAAPKRGMRGVVLGGDGALARRLGLTHVTDIGTLISGVKDNEDYPEQVIVDATGASADTLAHAHRCTHEALALLHVWLEAPHLGSGELVWVTQGAVAAAKDDAVEGLAQATLWGFVRSARSENPHRALRLVDIEASSTSAQLTAVLGVTGEPELVVRGASVRAARLSEVDAQPIPAARPWPTDGSVLITGGMGDLGALVARHLVVKYGVRNLLLVSRRGAETSGARELKQVLEHEGARVLLLACDVSQRQSVEELLRSISTEPPLRAVFHCAGVLDDGPVRALSPERIDGVFGPKVDGAMHLHEATRSMALDAFVLFSSVSGVFGGAGQANYAAANTFLDALAAHRTSRGLAGQSLAWGLWQPSGKGMTATLESADLARLERQGIAALSAEQGLRLLDEALARTEAMLVLARLQLSNLQMEDARPPALMRKLVKWAPSRSVAMAAEPQRNAAGLKERLMELAPAAQWSALLEVVQTEVALVCRLEGQDVAEDQPLKSLGLDSLMAVELRDRLRTRAGVSLPATLVFDHPTPRDIATYLKTLLLKTDQDIVAPWTNGRLLDPAGAPEPSMALSHLGAIDDLSNEELAALVRSL